MASVVSFTGNRYWTFRHRARTTVGREGLLYLLLTGAGLAIQVGCLRLTGAPGPRGLPYGPAPVTAIALAALFRFGHAALGCGGAPGATPVTLGK